MNKVEIYSHSQCSYCHQAKKLLNIRGIPFEEFDAGKNQEILQEMLRRTGGRTFPQIIVDNKSIGGFDQLRELDSQGQLVYQKN